MPNVITAGVSRNTNSIFPVCSQSSNDIYSPSSSPFMDRMHRQAREVDKMLHGKTRENLYLYTNTFPRTSFDQPKVRVDEFIPDRSLWCERLRPQLAGVHMWEDREYMDCYSLTPVTPRHALGCAHGGPARYGRVTYVNADAEMWETDITQWVHDNPLQKSRSSDYDGSQQTREADLSIYRFADPFPAWMPIYPILTVTPAQYADLAAMDFPLLTVTQGHPEPHPSYMDSDYVWTKRGRRVCPNNIRYPGLFDEGTRRSEFRHVLTTGDSGTARFALINNTLYFFATISLSNYEGAILGDHVDYINSLIARADVHAGDPTGHTVRTVALDSLL